MMKRRPNTKPARAIPLRYDDGFRGGMLMLLTSAVLVACWFTPILVPVNGLALPRVLIAVCAALSVFSIAFVLWTHRLFSRTDPELLSQIAQRQFRRGPSVVSRLLGFGDESSWAMSAAAAALLVAIGAVVVGGAGNIWLAILVLVTAGSSWATMVYAFALRYLRLHAGGQQIVFDLNTETEGEPQFIDFVSMSVMLSSVGALSAGHPTTREGLAAVRTHTFVAFAFNALVIAMTVSLVSSLIARG